MFQISRTFFGFRDFSNNFLWLCNASAVFNKGVVEVAGEVNSIAECSVVDITLVNVDVCSKVSELADSEDLEFATNLFYPVL